MRRSAVAAVLLFKSVALAGIVDEVRSAIARDDFAHAETQIATYRTANGVTPEMLEAFSWLGRGALAAGKLEKAETYAVETHRLALDQLKTRRLDAEKQLPIALGAAIEVQAQVLGRRGARGEAVGFLRRELETYSDTSIRLRIQKNINLLSLEGEPAPPLDLGQWLGPRPSSLSEQKGRVVLLFFWAHWCGDCKRQAPVLARLQKEFGDNGLVLIGPTQLYGYVARGQEAPPDEELKYIDRLRLELYSELPGMPAPVSEQNFKDYGASTTPTLVLVDRQGVVRLYHPGQMAYDDLAPRVRALL
jgi:thiol-disulfide isomerase/thioredoxin